MFDREHRRAFLKTSAALALGGGLLSRAGAQLPYPTPARKNPPYPAPVRVRPDVATLDPNGPELAALRKGVAAMKAASDSDPTARTGWVGQARIHLDEASPAIQRTHAVEPRHVQQHGIPGELLGAHRMTSAGD